MCPSPLTPKEARRVYDRVGRRQDSQAFYEDAAVRRLAAHGRLESCRAVGEVGCGTGRVARHWLAERLPGEARYLGLDLSPRMAAIARGRLAPWSDRARVVLADATRTLPVAPGRLDRLVATYVLDLLADDAVADLLAEAHRVLVPGGLLLAAGLTRGATPASRLVIALWRLLWRLSPRLVGGCRPRELAGALGAGWRLRQREVVVAWGVPSELLVAERLPAGAGRPPAPGAAAAGPRA